MAIDHPVAPRAVKEGGSLDSPMLRLPVEGKLGADAGSGLKLGTAPGVLGEAIGVGAIGSAAVGPDETGCENAGGGNTGGCVMGADVMGADVIGVGVTGGGATEGRGVSEGATSGRAGNDTLGGAPNEDPPGGNNVGTESFFGRGATIRDASNFGGSLATGTGA
ncbi:MAG: hypothetical protein LW724_08445 [Planctomycetaceae bacterium]|nr:hypothetical protein [Planctomycetaceae bacterium]